MTGKKGQMFVATAVFLTGLLFVVQQALVIYSVIDMTKPFQTKDSYSVTNIIDVINYTIITQEDTSTPIADCLDFENNLKELLSFMQDDFSKRGYLMISEYSLDCIKWNNNPSFPAPLNLTISFTGDFESFGAFKFHHAYGILPGPDTTGPSVSNTQSSPGSPTSSDPITITADGADTQSNIQSCDLRVVGVSGWQPMDADDGSYDSQNEDVNRNIGTLSDGSYTIEIRCTDTAGNPTSPIPTHGVTVSTPSTGTAISDCQGLQDMRDDLTEDYYLTQDIDCDAATHAGGALWNGGQGFEPIGPFTGTLDGKGFEINGLHINRAINGVGLFSSIESASSLTDIGLINVNISGNMFVGALAGTSYGNISNSFSTGKVTGTGFYIGGLVGQNGGTSRFANITNSYSTANVTAIQNIVGGLVGNNENGNVSNSYSTGSVTGVLSVGGLVGGCGQVAFVEGHIFNSYSTGKVTGNGNVGGLVGVFVRGTCTDSFWDTETSGQASDDCPSGSTGLPTAQMTQQSTFDPLWDFTNIWHIDDGTSYPCLQWQGGVGNCPLPPSIAISDCQGLQDMRNGLTTDYYLTQDIDCDAATRAGGALWNGGLGFEPIGCGFSNCGSRATSQSFAGTLDGRGYSIAKIFINRPAEDYVGLFGYTRNSEIKNVTLSDVDITGDSFVGGLAGHTNYGDNITNSSVTGTVTGADIWIGGLIGYSRLSFISDTYSAASVNGFNFVGGLVGLTQGTTSVITNSYVTGDVNGNNWVGGLIGINGIKTVDNSYATGDVNGNWWVGGLIGRNNLNITNCYSTGTVNGTGSYVGGLAGENIGSINKSYATGNVTGNNNVGGLVGSISASATCADSFWDTDTGYPTSNCGAGETGLPTAQMIQQDTFDPPWDFTSIWQINDGVSYPCLQWQGGVGSCPAPSAPAVPTWVYQESADVTDCANEACDGVWGTYELEGMSYIFDFNYTIPLGAQDSSLLQVRDGCGGANAPVNLSLNSLDWSSCDLRFRGNKASSLGSNLLYWYGWDGSGWTQLRIIGGCGEGVPGRFYEEAMWWKRGALQGWVYQECAGSVACSGNWGPSYPCGNTYDGNWSSRGVNDGSDLATVYWNYTKPSGALSNSQWQIRYQTMVGPQSYNVTIPIGCWQQDRLQFLGSIEYSGLLTENYFRCWDGSSWLLVGMTQSKSIYEEAMWWDFG